MEKELRIGNLLQRITNMEIVTVYGVMNETDPVYINEGICTNDCEPIPLTEEWLVKFGFGRCDEHEMSIVANGTVLVYDWHFKRCWLMSDHDNDVDIFINHIQYVNQLQNLYFTLTGKELTYE